MHMTSWGVQLAASGGEGSCREDEHMQTHLRHASCAVRLRRGPRVGAHDGKLPRSTVTTATARAASTKYANRERGSYLAEATTAYTPACTSCKLRDIEIVNRANFK